MIIIPIKTCLSVHLNVPKALALLSNTPEQKPSKSAKEENRQDAHNKNNIIDGLLLAVLGHNGKVEHDSRDDETHNT